MKFSISNSLYLSLITKTPVSAGFFQVVKKLFLFKFSFRSKAFFLMTASFTKSAYPSNGLPFSYSSYASFVFYDFGLKLPSFILFLINNEVCFFTLCYSFSLFSCIISYTVSVLAITYLKPATHILRSSLVGANKTKLRPIVAKVNGNCQSSGIYFRLIWWSGIKASIIDLKGITIFFWSDSMINWIGLS